MEILIHCISSAIMDILIYYISSFTLETLIYCILYMAMTTHVTFCISCIFMAIVLLCIQDWCMYLQSYVEIDYCIALMSGQFFHLGLHYYNYGMDFIMYFGHHITPLTSHIRGNLLQLFYHTWLITYLWPSLYLYRIFRTHGLILYFYVSKFIPKNTCLLMYVTFNHIFMCIHGY